MDLIKCFKALSDNTRLRLVFILQRYELNVNEIVRVVDMIQSGVSRHLKILTESGLLIARKEGSFTYYSAVDDDGLMPLNVMIKKNLEKNEISQKDIEKAAEMIIIRQNRTKRFFKSVAPQWDRLKKEVLGTFDLNKKIKEMVCFDGNISDLGCGTGELLEMLLVDAKHKLIGIDSSPEMLAQAKLKLNGVDGTQLRLGELEYLPMGDREIDTAIMNMVLHHISQPKRPIEEVFRVIKPGGFFILSDFEKHDKENIREIIGGEWLGFKKENITRWMTQQGFKIINVSSFNVNQGLTINIFIAQKPLS
ncbi:MAG: metalloregulator ArsR/SmtB family transcription factor [Desulfobacula sp.]|nr:metalloregulator ArsR/SmtB family transcription factor [Desulfobacula sp.]